MAEEFRPARKKTGVSETRVRDLRKRHTTLINERSSWLTDWRTLAEHYQPRRFRTLENRAETNQPGTGGLHDRLVANESVRAMRVLAAGMQGGMTSPARPWFRLGTPDPRLEQVSSIKAWLGDVQQIMLSTMARSNFYDAIHQLYSDLGTFGISCMMMVEDDNVVVRYRVLPAGSYCLINDNNGRVSGFWRLLDMTAEQIVVKFGEDNVSQAVKTAFAQWNTKDQWFSVVQVVIPNPDRKPGRADAEGMVYASYYYEYNADEGSKGKLLGFGGYTEQPFAGPRWDVVGDDVYGRSPGMDTLNDVRQLQSMASSLNKGLHKQVDPPMVAPLDFFDVDTVPGAINNIDTARGEGLKPLYQIQPDVRGTMIAIDALKNDIREGLFNDLFKMLALAERGTKTATEVKQLLEEKLIMLGPVIERLHAELLDVVIDRTFAICLRKGVLPPPPEELSGMDLKVEYISLLAQAQKMIGTSAIDQFMALLGSFAEIFPEMLDIADVDEVGESYAEMLGVAPKIVRPRDKREKRRKERQQAQQQMEQAAQMQAMSQSAKNLAAAPVPTPGAPEETPNALAALMQGMVAP